MEKTIKQIYVSLQLTEKEVRVLVGEYYNTRFNIIKVSKVPCEGIDDFKISDKENVIECIKKAISDTSDKIGTKIEKVILLLPSYNFKRYPLKVNVFPAGRAVSKDDVSKAVSNSLKTQVDEGSLIINPVVVKYTINGISSRRFPENEYCDVMTVDIDLLCADKSTAFDYVSIVEECGVKVLDICLEPYAICKEAALIEQSLNQNMILLDISNSYTNLSLLSKGKLVSSELVFEGLNTMVDDVYQKYHLPKTNLLRLLKYNVDFDSQYPDDSIYAWTKDDTSYSISVKDLSKIVESSMNRYIEKISTMCKPIVEKGNCTCMIVGAGSEMSSLTKKISEAMGVEVKTYFPDTIGVRDSSLTSLYGSFFAYREKAVMKNLNVTCVNMIDYENIVDKRTIDVEGETLTTKIKNLFEQYMNKEESK